VSSVIPFPVVASVPDEAFSLHDAVAGVRRRHRRLITAAGRWALARGVPLPADHVALWAGAVEYAVECGAGLADADGAIGSWSGPGSDGSWWAAVCDWCSTAGCRPPADLAGSFRHLSDFLSDSGRLDPGGDPAGAPRQVFAGYGGGRLDGPPTPPPGPRAA